MAEKKRIKGLIYKREVYNVTLQDERRCPDITNCKSEKGIEMHKDRFFETNSKLNEGKIHRTHTEEIVIYKTNTYTEKEDYSCEVCDVACSGIENFKLHIGGKKHIKNLKKLNILKEMRKFPWTGQATTNTKHELKFTHIKEFNQEMSLKSQMRSMRLEDPVRSSEDASCTKPPFDYCEICKKYFTIRRGYHQHFEKSEHFIKDQNMKDLLKNVVIGTGDGSMFSCGMCSKAFTGVVPYKQHLLSSIHIKNKEKVRDVSNIAQSANGMLCEECGMKFSGIVPFSDHLKGSSHRRLLKKKHLLAKAERELLDVLKNTAPKICEDDVEVFDRIIFSETKNGKGNRPGERRRELLKNEILNKQDIQENNLLQFSDSDDSSDDILLEL